MKKETIARCVGEIDDKFIDEAQTYRKTRANGWVKLTAAAACLALAVLSAVYFTRPDIAAPAHPEPGKQSGAQSEYALEIPAVELPELSGGAVVDMMGLVVYKGGVYTQAEGYFGDDAQRIKSLVGECVGVAKGNISEWSKQEDYATELASTYSGNIYTVKGYSPEFRLCYCVDTQDEFGNYGEYIMFLERLNGIGVSNGSDVFGERLGLRDNWVSARYQTHEDWDKGGVETSELTGVTKEQMEAFFDELYSSPFECVCNTNGSFYTDGKEQGHIYFEMSDGTTVGLRLFEGGYVGYDSMGWYFVKMPGDAFDAVFAACT